MAVISLLDAVQLADDIGFSQEELEQKISSLKTAVIDYWSDQADRELSRTNAIRYAKAIQEIERSPLRFVLALLGDLENMWEQGAPPWDLRETVLKSPKAKTSKAGHRYLSIMMRHSTPGSDGRAGPQMGSQFGDDADKIGGIIHSAAKVMRPTLSGAEAEAAIARVRLADPAAAQKHAQRLSESKNSTLWGGIPELDPPNKPRVGRLQPALSPILRAWHKTDIHAGMVRFGKGGKTAGYATFRTISTNPNSRRDAKGKLAMLGGGTANWMHPGFKPLNLADRVIDRLHTVLIPGEFPEA